MSAEGSKKAIVAAMSANGGIAVLKFIGFLVTGSSSMIAEAVHSVADTANQGLLLVGQQQAKRNADGLHPFGYGRARYFYSFVVALVIFALGSLFAVYEGVHKIAHPEHMESPIVAVLILLGAMCLEGYSFLTAMRESRSLKGDVSWWRFIRRSRNPELPVVLLEDTGALIGLALALLGVGLAWGLDMPVFDGIGTLAIGILLGVIAIVLIVEMQSLLIGEGATEEESAAILRALEGSPAVQRVIHCKTQYLGPDEMLVAAKIAIGEASSAAEIAQGIDTAEAALRAAVPNARVVYLEPDLDRSR
ncbi:cation diffusion facilitator family transporter [Tsukamurella sp. 8F]|uniref:cation diffusion facilitator family transporter n=1 Tax=unclassified Tsukamurella TaxID=2633480 RepID=UPI0023B991FA|nr:MULTISPECIES: cation diffusion facilitator family transporter [unclassified Tsukamurella]MDF0530373.1 cation diffusion facilitator family transporter [Tsukamurella sp. 8J]MDF0587670.1 cation diffusion facilitator family transporter [Tsukamurella sp. 8F]